MVGRFSSSYQNLIFSFCFVFLYSGHPLFLLCEHRMFFSLFPPSFSVKQSFTHFPDLSDLSSGERACVHPGLITSPSQKTDNHAHTITRSIYNHSWLTQILVQTDKIEFETVFGNGYFRFHGRFTTKCITFQVTFQGCLQTCFEHTANILFW